MRYNGKVTKVEDIKTLPWAGNWHSDSHLFNLIDDFILCDTTSRADKMEAYKLMGEYGMGDTSKCTDEMLDQYLENCIDVRGL